MIAAHAISLGAILVTNNTQHFSRFEPALTMENWVAIPRGERYVTRPDTSTLRCASVSMISLSFCATRQTS